MTKDWVKDIETMHARYNVKEKIKNLSPEMLREFLKFRINFLAEEFNELGQAVNSSPVDAEETVDALIDLCVVAIGTLDLFGVDAHKAWQEVYNANMNKEVGVKASRPNPFNLPDLVKPNGWTPPDHSDNYGLLKNLK
jgi:predicted HAD superfamily Cof-like phosphohydrolase